MTPVDVVQPEEKLVREKLCPVLAFARVQTIDQAISSRALDDARSPGSGHSAAIHSKNEANIMAFAAALPALRVAVNAGCSLGAAGFETHLGPSMTIGTGFAGGSSLGDNLTPQHLVNFTRIAYNKDASEMFGNFAGPRSAASCRSHRGLRLPSRSSNSDDGRAAPRASPHHS